jgi:hypothetical protein
MCFVKKVSYFFSVLYLEQVADFNLNLTSFRPLTFLDNPTYNSLINQIIRKYKANFMNDEIQMRLKKLSERVLHMWRYL